jgi:hypothetical protein
MNGEAHTLVQILWEGPFTIDQVLTGAQRHKSGVYQIYGQHVVFGSDALLYLGMTGRQLFGARFKQHWERWLRYESDISIRLGSLDDANVPLLADVEALTIWWHSPPYNSKNIWQYEGVRLRIQNLGARGRLHPEYSSHWKPARIPPEDENG